MCIAGHNWLVWALSGADYATFYAMPAAHFERRRNSGIVKSEAG